MEKSLQHIRGITVNEDTNITIHHIQNKTENYSVIFNECLRRDDLSGLAKGIWCYLMTLPPTWKIHRKELFTHFTEGRRAKTNAFNELIEKGYIQAVQIRNGNLFGAYEYNVFESSLYRFTESDKTESDKEPLLNTDGAITNESTTDESTTDDTKISLSKDKDKELPEPSRDDLLPEYIKVATEVAKSGLFKKVPLFKKNSTIPVKDALYTQDMILSILKGTFIEDYHVTVDSNQDISWLENMTWDRVASASSNPKLTNYYHPDNWLDFFVAYRTTHKSKFLSWARPQFGTVPSNCNATTPNVTMQKDGTIPESVQLSLKTLKSCSKFKPRDEKKLIDNLIFLDSWIKQEYSWVEEYNNGKHRDMYDSLPNMMEGFVYVMNHWESRSSFDESFVEHGKWGWNSYVKECRKNDVELELGPMSKKNIEAERKRKQMQAELDKEKKNGQENR